MSGTSNDLGGREAVRRDPPGDEDDELAGAADAEQPCRVQIPIRRDEPSSSNSTEHVVLPWNTPSARRAASAPATPAEVLRIGGRQAEDLLEDGGVLLVLGLREAPRSESVARTSTPAAPSSSTARGADRRRRPA